MMRDDDFGSVSGDGYGSGGGYGDGWCDVRELMDDESE